MGRSSLAGTVSGPYNRRGDADLGKLPSQGITPVAKLCTTGRDRYIGIPARGQPRIYSPRMRGRGGCLGLFGGCLAKLVLLAVAGVAAVYVLEVVTNPWALHIGGRSTPL